MRIRIAAALSIFLVSLSGASAAQDKAAYAQALAGFQKDSVSKDARTRARAVEGLGSATYEAVDAQTFKLVVGTLSGEIGRDQTGGKAEEKVSGDVLDACEGALRKITNAKVLEQLSSMAFKKGMPGRVRFYLIRALAKNVNEKIEEQLKKALEDAEPLVPMAAADALAEGGSEASLPVLIGILADTKRAWEIKLSALTGIERLGKTKAKDAAVIEPLIEALAKLADGDGRVKVELMRVLNGLLGLTGDKEIKSDDPNYWKTAWAAIKDGKDSGGDGGTRVEPTEFFGLKVRSSRIVFLLDRTGSMEAPLRVDSTSKETPKADTPTAGAGAGAEREKESPADIAARAKCEELLKKWETGKTSTRMDVLKREFLRTLFNLDARVHFNVVWYEGNQQPWKDQLVPANWANKLSIMTETDRMSASGGTNIWGAVEHAYRMVAQPQRPDVIQADKKGNYATVVHGADTFFLMTDGAHNTGKFLKDGGSEGSGVDREGFLSELRKINRIRKVIIHTICLGSERHDFDLPDASLMEDVAKETGGTFAHIKG